MRRAKIVCTLGPSSLHPDMLERMLAAGMDVARLNFSHATHEQHAETIRCLRAASLKVRKAVGIMGDLQGPKIRTGKIHGGEVLLKDGAELTITTDESVVGNAERISTTYPFLPADVSQGDRVLLDDGLIELKVLWTNKNSDLGARVVHGGVLRNSKGINIPGVNLRAEALSAKDKEDLAFGIQAGIDYVGLSFVRRPEDLDLARAVMADCGRQVPVIAKLEKPEALSRLDEILDRADGVMVARGDLGVEIPPEDVPAIQKDIVRRANKRGIPVIVATQMLNSMIDHPLPTRAEASDVANAVYDRADALMLSGETASGKYPMEALQMMHRIILAAEGAKGAEPRIPELIEMLKLPASFPEVVCGVACRAARESGAKLIAAFTLSGTTARLLSHYRPAVPIVAFSPNQEVRRRLALLWGVIPRVLEPIQETENMVRRVEEELLSRELARKGDKVVIVFGAPIGQPGKINSLRLHEIST